ncbi:hypothetical protein [Kitasatospora paracochleata]|uniref:ANTAR domain-containing protein n=1 Tax=Kitasatospora paracochleata TaxID=58354 RepID=A0ABT1JA89_9ACTN|nr:hypothetical protein [Kitasatospora paracochleata]MCP2313978.1 hypothetical protein [Kitasatospora paracochleata]
MSAVTDDSTPEQPQFRKGTRDLTPTQRVLADEIAERAELLYEGSPDLTRAEAVEAAARQLGDRPKELIQQAHRLYDAHADLTWRQAVHGAALQLGYLPPPSVG